MIECKMTASEVVIGVSYIAFPLPVAIRCGGSAATNRLPQQHHSVSMSGLAIDRNAVKIDT